ncbi:MAG: ferritin-like domain-containing protein [Gammaproteobacteria bacterium]|nr:ferritin-like domain-containing protein [Gammaproteobacteria bacterium]
MQNDPVIKTKQVDQLYTQLTSDQIDLSVHSTVETVEIPGRPSQPQLVHPSKVARRNLNTEQGRVALVHAICHIEFNAINLALDAVYRFQHMPRDYYFDWMKVAAEESKHFLLLSDRLNQLNSAYGHHPAHNGLWEMAIKTQHNIVERMALVPRVLEARGLDVTPGMISRLEFAGDIDTVNILKIILQDEIGHVEIGTRWFRHACKQQNLDSEATFISLLKQYNVTVANGPLHIDARQQAGFSKEELKALS